MTDVRDFLSSAELEDKQKSLQAAKEAIAGPVPLINEAPDTTFKLQRGLYHNGIRKTEVVVRELTGGDEETLAKTKEPTDYYDTVLALGTASIGDLDFLDKPLAERKSLVRDLLIGERDQLFLMIIKTTFGETRTINFTCTRCREAQDITLYLSEDFKPQEVDPELLAEDAFEFKTSRGDNLTVRLALGDDQHEAFARKGATQAEQNSTILSRCITKRNGGLIVDPVEYVRSLSMRDRSELLNELVRRQPTINLEVKTTCAACSSDQRLTLGWGDLFRT